MIMQSQLLHYSCYLIYEKTMECLVLKLPSNVRCLTFLLLHRVHTFLIVIDGRFHSTQISRDVKFYIYIN